MNAHGQSCLPNGITFNSQAQINSFHANYPGCTSIEGDVTIDPQGGNIANLNGLNGLVSIGGTLYIRNSTALPSLAGLSTLTSVGGNLRIEDNVVLGNLNGLNNLTTVGYDVQIGGSTWQTNSALTSLSGLDNLTTVGGWFRVSDNPILQTLNGLGSLSSVSSMIVSNNPKLTSLTGPQTLNSIQEYIRISNNPLLTDLGFLANFSEINASLEINDNTALSSLSALQNVTSLNNGFKISGSPAISNLADLENLTTVVGGLTIENMDGMIDLHGLENISILDGPYGSSISISDNALLSNLSGLNPNISTLQYLNISGNALLSDLQGLVSLTVIGTNQAGQLRIADNPLLTSLNGLQNLNAVFGTLVISGNPSLQTLSSLDNLATIITLSLSNNNNLQDLTGLGNLTSLGNLILSGSSSNTFQLSGLLSLNTIGSLRLSNLSQLKNLSGLESVAVTGDVYIEQNASLENLNGLQGSITLGQINIFSNPALTSLTGMENVTKIFDGLRINDNPVLSDLNALSNLKTLRHDLFVFGNQSLSDCAVFGLCLFISDPPQLDSVGIGNNAPGCNTSAEVSSLCASTSVTVEVLLDNNATCTSGLQVADMPVRLTGGGQNTLKPTGADGQAKFRYFDTLPFQITLPQLSDGHWNVCEVRQNYLAINGGDSTHVSMFLSPKVLCPELNVKLNLPTNFRGCLVNSDIHINVQNSGAKLAEGGKIAVVMPTVFDLLNTEPLMSGQNGDTLYFELGDLKPFETAQVKLSVKTKCDTFLMGQTLCWEAFAAMDNPCPQFAEAFSEIKLSATCVGGTIVRLGLKNIGDAPTQAWHEYKIIRNELVQYNNAFNLNAQESLSFDFPADGATWRIEATKFDDGTQTAVGLENCGGLTPGLITAFWLDHGPVEYDFDCRQVVQAYDPNRKTAVPTGVGFEHIISTGQPIFYTIDFQNTGTDTAFRVQLTDKLSDYLDVNTFKPEGASHPCSWEVRGDNLEVLFSPIALPDSNVNEIASHGYFSFSIYPKSNLVDGTQIYNFAKIIFDFNWPIWTNWVDHTLGKLTVSVDEAQALDKLWQVLGNPTRDVAIFQAESFVSGEKRFELFEASGRLVRSAQFTGQEFEFQRDMLPSGLYFFRISDGSDRVFTGKIVVAE